MKNKKVRNAATFLTLRINQYNWNRINNKICKSMKNRIFSDNIQLKNKNLKHFFRIMKLLNLFLFVAIFTLSATNSYSQSEKVSLNKRDVKLEEVLSEIEKQTNYLFIYNDQVNAGQKVSVTSQNEATSSVLNRLLSNTGISYALQGSHILLTNKKASNNVDQVVSKLVTGTVIDKHGELLIGVTVVVKGNPSRGTTTDLDGKYSISAQEGETLEFTYVGFKSQEIKVGTSDVINVTMEESDVALSDVVVTALGIKRESKVLTYNVQELKGEDLTVVKDANFINSLAGKVAGIQINQSASGIGGSARVVMRGTKSIMGNNNALYVVDGIPLYDVRGEQPENVFESPDGGDRDAFANINPDDIESLSVLSGPAAAALYGSQGANGVILITTKKGEQGLKINYSNNSIFLKPFVMPEFQDTYGSRDQSFQSWGPKKSSDMASYDPKDFFQTGYVETNSLAASFGGERNKTYVSVAATNSRGIIPNNKLNRYNMTVRNTADVIKDKLEFDFSFSYINEDNRNMMTQGQYHNPLLPIYLFPRGDDIANYKIYETFDPARNFKTQNWPSKYGNQGLGIENPYWTTNRKFFENERNRYIMFAALNYKPLEWLNLSGRVRMDNMENTFERKIYASSDKLFASETGNYMNQRMSDKQLYMDFLASVDKRFGDFSLTGAIGTSYFHYDQQLNSYEGHLLMVPNRFTQNNINKDDPQSKVVQTGFRDNTQAVFATAQLGWKSLVFLDLTARNDWSSALKGTKSTSVFYPSVGVSGIISDMFDISKSQISFLKMRFSYSEVGNPPPRFITRAAYDLDNGNLSTQSAMPFSNLKAERTKAYEVGTNMKFWDNRFNLDVTYYNTDTYNQLFRFDAAPSSLFTEYYVNAGKVNNWGIEASFGYNDTFGEVGFSTNLNFTMNRNKIKTLIPEGTIDPTTGTPIVAKDGIDMSSTGTYRMRLTEGGTLGDIYVSTLSKDSKGNIKVDPSTGTISADPNNWVKAGSVAPRFNFGWSNTVSYKGFDFSFLIDARIGGVGVSATQALLDRYGVSKASAVARDNGGVLVNGQLMDAEAYYSVVSGGTTGILSEYVYSMTNVRLREASLSYTFPGKLFNNKISSLSVSLIGRNLFMFYNKAPYDPELTASTGTYFQGLDYFMQPSLRNIGFGVKVQF